MQQITKDDAALCLMMSFLALIIAVIVMSIGDASLAQPHLGSPPNLGMEILVKVASAVRYVAVVGLVSGAIGTLILPSRSH